MPRHRIGSRGTKLKSKSGIAAQALAAAALAAVVYFAFIAPNGPGPLTSIEIENGGPVGTAPTEPVIQVDRRKPRTATATIPAPLAPVTTVPAGPSTSVAVETPSGSQYQGAVDQILSRTSRQP